MSTYTGRPMAGLVGALVGLTTKFGELSEASMHAMENMPFRLPTPRGDGRALARKVARARRDRRWPHSTPTVIAICRSRNGRKYYQCATRDQAIAHAPYLIEHVNGWGQVTRRERLA